jgi:hypothetical protein
VKPPIINARAPGRDSAPRGTLRIYTTAQAAAWNEILSQFSQFDFYHTADYHRLEETRLGGRCELIVYAEGSRVAALPLMFTLIDTPAWKSAAPGALWAAKSVYGYVGWLATDDTTLPVLGRFGLRLQEYMRGRGVVSLFGRMHPLLPRQNNELLIGRVESIGKTIGIDLRHGLAAYEQGLSSGHRYEIRKLREAGCVVTTDRGPGFLEEFHALYTATMRRLNAGSTYFYSQEYLEALMTANQFETRIFKATYQGRLCAMAMFIKCGRFIQYHLSCSEAGHTKYPATKLLIDEASRWSFSVDCDWLHLGGGLGAQQDALFQFKAGFGGVQVPFNIWKCIFRDADYAGLSNAAGHNSDAPGIYFPAFQAARL